ncbi:hypothetical protein ACQEVF_47380 [Nonomuraea polychroma]|uniref:hypothetical protein n=1 Tax=Nonomuraea polychroma TaxID=46176 RepID=UPI003D8CB6C8
MSAWFSPDGQLVALWPVQLRAAENAALLAEQRACREAYERANQAQLGGSVDLRETDTMT